MSRSVRDLAEFLLAVIDEYPGVEKFAVKIGDYDLDRIELTSMSITLLPKEPEPQESVPVPDHYITCPDYPAPCACEVCPHSPAACSCDKPHRKAPDYPGTLHENGVEPA